jgi:geranylgeranyl diphosphate synthase type II
MNNLNSHVLGFENAFRIEIEKIKQTKPFQLYEPIAYSLSIGGKRLRPALMLHATSLFAYPTMDHLPAAMAIEIFHNFTLLHDDIMDKADVRRGLPTVHKKYSENAAILSGDAMSILAFKYLAQENSASLPEILNLFSDTALEVCDGQQMDMDFESSSTVTIAEYLEMIRLKTAVLIASSLKIGALVSNAPLSDANLLYEYGINVGLAFQLQDDWLDVFGDPAVFGKKQGGDICANKKTYLLLRAIEKADQSSLAILTEWIEKKEFNPIEKVAAIKGVYEQTKVSEETHLLMLTYQNKALAALGKLAVSPEKKMVLEAFALEATERMK